MLDFAISPDSARVVYRADSTDTLNELWSVPIGGGAVTRLNRTLAAGGDVQAFLISPDSSWVVYGADQDQDAKDELLRVPLAGGTVEDVNGPLVFGGDVSLTFLSAPVFTISPDSLNIVYAADEIVDGEIELFKSVVGGPPGAPLDVVAVPGDTQVTVTFARAGERRRQPDHRLHGDAGSGHGWAGSTTMPARPPRPISSRVSPTGPSTPSPSGRRMPTGWARASAPSDPVTPGRRLPGAPIVSGPGLGATGWNNAATVAFAPPASDGGSAITGYMVNWTSVPNTPGGVDIHAGNPLLNHYVRLLTNGVSYTFTVRAINADRYGARLAALQRRHPGLRCQSPLRQFRARRHLGLDPPAGAQRGQDGDLERTVRGRQLHRLHHRRDQHRLPHLDRCDRHRPRRRRRRLHPRPAGQRSTPPRP